MLISIHRPRLLSLALVVAGSSLLTSIAGAQTLTSSGSGRFEFNGTGQCLVPGGAVAVGTPLVAGTCSAATSNKIALGTSSRYRSPSQGTLMIGGLCVDSGSGIPRLATCNAPCYPNYDATCTAASRTQEWTWTPDGRIASAATPNQCLTSQSTATGELVSLSGCGTTEAFQSFLPLDFNLTFSSGLSASSFYRGPHPQVAPPFAPFPAPSTACPVPSPGARNYECLDVFLDLEGLPNDPLDAFQCNATPAQWFHFDAENELLTTSGTCVTATGPGASVTIQQCTGAAGQEWLYSTPELFSSINATFLPPYSLDIQGQNATPLTALTLASSAFGTSLPGAQTWDANLAWPLAPTVGYSQTVTAPGGGTGGWVDVSQEVAGDFDGDGVSDIAYVFKSDGVAGTVTNGRIDIDVYTHKDGYSKPHRWSTELGGWVDGMVFLSGDFDGDHIDDIAVAFPSSQNDIDIDVHRSTGCAFSAPARWGDSQGGWVNPSTWLAGDFNGDGKTDLAYVFSIDQKTIDLDVHTSNGSAFSLENWNTSQGGWLDLTISDPKQWFFIVHPGEAASDVCKHCTHTAQWTVGDFNGDHYDDLALVFNNGSGLTTMDVHLSTGSKANGGFTLQHAGGGSSQGGWIDQSWWVAEDMDNDGRADLVNVFDRILYGADGDDAVEVHSSHISGLTVPNADGFTNHSYSVGTPFNYFATPADDKEVRGSVLGGHFAHGTSSQLGDIALVSPLYGVYHNPVTGSNTTEPFNVGIVTLQ